MASKRVYRRIFWLLVSHGRPMALAQKIISGSVNGDALYRNLIMLEFHLRRHEPIVGGLHYCGTMERGDEL